MSSIIRHAMPPGLKINPGAKDFTYYCSPLRSCLRDVVYLNMTLALLRCELLTEGKRLGTVIAPHAFLPAVFDDKDAKLRETALAFGKELIKRSRGLYVVSQNVFVSPGMADEIAFAAELGKPVEFEDQNLLNAFRQMSPGLSDKVRLSELSPDARIASSDLGYRAVLARKRGWYLDAECRMARMLLDCPEQTLPFSALDNAYGLALEAAGRLK